MIWILPYNPLLTIPTSLILINPLRTKSLKAYRQQLKDLLLDPHLTF